MAIAKYDQFDFLIDIVPREDIKPQATSTSTAATAGAASSDPTSTPTDGQHNGPTTWGYPDCPTGCGPGRTDPTDSHTADKSTTTNDKVSDDRRTATATGGASVQQDQPQQQQHYVPT